MRVVAILSFLFSIFCTSPVWADDAGSPAPAADENQPPEDEDKPCVEDDPRPKCLFEFDENGQVKTKDGKAERTFKFPAMKVGFLFDAKNPDITPFGTLEIVDWYMFDEGFSIDVGAASGRAIIGLSWEAIPIMKLGPMLWGGYNVREKDWAAGLGFTLLKF